MDTIEGYFTIDQLPLETRGHLIRDVACSVFFGYYDNRKGYINDDFKKGKKLGIYGFFDIIKNASQVLTDYRNKQFDKVWYGYDKYGDTEHFDKKFDTVFWKHHPYMGFDFTNLIVDFHYHLKTLGIRYNLTINSDFYKKVVPIVLEEINLLCDKFIPEVNEDFYNIKGFSTKYITTVNMTYEVELLPTISQTFKSKSKVYNYELEGSDIYQINEQGRSTLYATQTYELDNNGEIEKITTTILSKIKSGVLVRYRDTFI